MEILNPHVVTTRKPHVCFGCGRKFLAGTKMERAFVVDDKPWTSYICSTCMDVEQSMQYGSEFGFGDLRDDALEREAALK